MPTYTHTYIHRLTRYMSYDLLLRMYIRWVCTYIHRWLSSLGLHAFAPNAGSPMAFPTPPRQCCSCGNVHAGRCLGLISDTAGLELNIGAARHASDITRGCWVFV